jgi:hypothetical protein
VNLNDMLAQVQRRALEQVTQIEAERTELVRTDEQAVDQWESDGGLEPDISEGPVEGDGA